MGASAKWTVFGVASVLLAVVVLSALLVPAQATHVPADRVGVSGSTLEKMVVQMEEGSASEVVELLRGSIRTSTDTDLIFRVTAECALWTDVTTVGNAVSESVATVKLWVEVDGAVVPVSSDDDQETGKVVFCNRAFKMETTNFDDDDATIATYLRTRNANAFNWALLNLGDTITPHQIVVKGQLEAEVTGVGEAKAIVGKRTLIVEPVRLATDASI